VKSKILIVEDVSIEAMNFEQSLKSLGYNVVGVTATGEDAIKKVVELKPDLVLMDIILKGDMDGIETATQIKKEFDTAVVYLTAHPEESIVKRAKLTSPYGYLTKPVNKTELKNTIELSLYKYQNEKKLKENENRFRDILENSLDVAYKRRLDSDQYEYLSPVIEKILDYSVEELISMPSSKVMELIHPHDLNKVKEIFDSAISGKTNKYNLEYRIKQKNGKYKWLNDYGSIVQGKESTTLIGSIRDITERKKAEDALIESEEKYRTLFESNPNYTILLGLDGVILDINAAAEDITGLSKDKFMGKHFTELEIFPEDELSKHEEIYPLLSKGEYKDPYESKIYDKKGKVRWLETIWTVIKKDEKSNSILVINNDITKRKKAEYKIKASLKEKETLLKEIHHRVKNNLQIISSLLDLQERYVKNDPTAVNVLKEIKNRVMSMAMIHEMIYQSEDLSHINFSEYIRNLISNLFQSYGANSSITSVINIEQIYMNIETAVPLGLIISELISNSLKYAFPEDKKGEILVNLTKNEKFELTISDNGIGIPKKIDFNTESTLGLKLVRSLINQIDGTVQLDRTKGTKYTITFHELTYKKRI
jgi:PAS domain S-box-containing protein